MLKNWLSSISRKNKFLLFIFFILTISTSATLSYLTFSKSKSSQQPPTPQPAVLSARDENYFETPPEELKSLNVLLLGYGGAGHQGGFLADVIQVVHFDFESSKIALISIPRDLWVELPSGTSKKINQAFAADISNQKDEIKEAPITKDMANVVTGLPIDYFVGVDFVGFQRLIGIHLKGIEVEVSETLDDPWYPIRGEEQNICDKTPEEVAQLSAQYSGFELERQFECRYEHLLFKPGTIHMEGGDALAFSRSRHGSAGGDFSRSKRQQEVLRGIKDKLFKLETYKNAPEFFIDISHTISTDLDVEAIQYLAPALRLTQDYEVIDINLNTENVFTSSQSSSGQSIVIPKGGSWTEVHEFIQNKT